MKKAAVLFLAFMLLGLCACSKEDSVPAAQEPVSDPEAVSTAAPVSDAMETVGFYKDIQFYDQWNMDTLLCRVEYPVLIPAGAGAELSAAVDALNARTAATAQEIYAKLSGSVQADIELKVENASNYLNYTDAYIMRSDSRALSVVFRTENYTRGIYDSLSFASANFDAASGKELALGKVVSDMGELGAILKTALEEKYPKVEFYGLEASMQQFVETPERFVWALGYQGISFYFAPYELAGMDAGTLTVGLRYEDYPQLFSLYYTRQPYSYVVPLVEGECLNYDLDMDGVSDEIRLMPHEEKGKINGLDISVASKTFTINTVIESYDAYVIYAGLGRSYLFMNAFNGTGYGYISVYRLERSGASLVGMIYDTSLQAAGFTPECPGIPLLTQPENILLGSKIELLCTLTGVKTYFIGASGLPESGDEYYRVYANTTLTAKTPFATAAIDPASGRGLNTAARVEPGTRMYYLRSDGRSFVDMMSEDGVCCRMYVSGRGDAQTVNGMSVADCFDGVIYN
ncbi:MAG: hypothetical protein IJZ91_03645 [Oscillospiraceae bacterium]|nr:hypothetical protein [Oscillospiraceae bacterium]